MSILPLETEGVIPFAQSNACGFVARSIAEVILAPAIHHTEDVTYKHVVQDALQNIRHPRSYSHPDFTSGYTDGQSYDTTHQPTCAFTLADVLVVLRDNLARHDHGDLSAFYQAMGWETTDDACRVGFVTG